jgi:hypothetical protein
VSNPRATANLGSRIRNPKRPAARIYNLKSRVWNASGAEAGFLDDRDRGPWPRQSTIVNRESRALPGGQPFAVSGPRAPA